MMEYATIISPSVPT